jgi:hypothetical protein
VITAASDAYLRDTRRIRAGVEGAGPGRGPSVTLLPVTLAGVALDLAASTAPT